MITTTQTTETFQVTSGKVNICDPCYSSDCIDNYHIPAKNGTWKASMETVNSFGTRVSKLTVWHDSISMPFTPDFSKWKSLRPVYVDSGQAGIFDCDIYDESGDGDSQDTNCFYGKCCEQTCDFKENRVMFGGVVDEKGFCCSSGYGDGGYICFGKFEKKKLVAVVIIFISDEEDENE